MQTNACPCCRGALLRHIRRSDLYWFCSSCRQEIPDILMDRPSLLNNIKSKVPRPKTAA